MDIAAAKDEVKGKTEEEIEKADKVAQIVKNMLKKGIKEAIISKVTSLTITEINKLKG